jgi:ABC-type Fe3+-siderophore transport system permease subunit
MKRFLLTLAGLITPLTAHAYRLTDSGWSCSGFLKCGTSQDAVTDLTSNIISAVGAFILALGVIAIFYGAIRMVTSQGEEGKDAGKKAILYALLGIALAMLTGAIIEFVRDYIYLLGR